jgi:predicted site-specific integrase-resolvase
MDNKLHETAPATGDAFLDEKQLLARLPISRRTAFTWVQTGKLPCVKIGRRKLFHWPSVEAALLRLQRGGIV